MKRVLVILLLLGTMFFVLPEPKEAHAFIKPCTIGVCYIDMNEQVCCPYYCTSGDTVVCH